VVVVVRLAVPLEPRMALTRSFPAMGLSLLVACWQALVRRQAQTRSNRQQRAVRQLPWDG
jgi:hypothetical protein